VKNRRRVERNPALAYKHARYPENAEKPSLRKTTHRQSAEKPDSPCQRNLAGTKIRRFSSFMKYPG